MFNSKVRFIFFEGYDLENPNRKFSFELIKTDQTIPKYEDSTVYNLKFSLGEMNKMVLIKSDDVGYIGYFFTFYSDKTSQDFSGKIITLTSTSFTYATDDDDYLKPVGKVDVKK